MTGRNTKYGYCVVSETWVPRDEMLSINVKTYNEDNEETKIQIRLCESAFDKVKKSLGEMRWTNELMTREELIDEYGVDPEEQRSRAHLRLVD